MDDNEVTAIKIRDNGSDEEEMEGGRSEEIKWGKGEREKRKWKRK